VITFDATTRVYIAVGSTDMRKSINGLMVLTQDLLKQDPFSKHVFVFCNRLRDKIKILYWHNNGFWLFYRRLEQERFYWPVSDKPSIEMTARELSWLLEGLDVSAMTPHKSLNYSDF